MKKPTAKVAAKKAAPKKVIAKAVENNPFRTTLHPRPAEDPADQVHLLAPGIKCDTEARGFATPGGRSIKRIVLDATEGFIPLWKQHCTLRWRFRHRSFLHFDDPSGAKQEMRNLLAEALLQWGNAAPIRFKEVSDNWDFEVVMRKTDDCEDGACVLASAFFPDSGRHRLDLYPFLLAQSRPEMVETLIHEIGHIFGLRHFFAQLKEKGWPSEIYGTHTKFSIMNYGTLSKLTPTDKNDITRLYKKVWDGTVTEINGTPIKQVKPFHYT